MFPDKSELYKLVSAYSIRALRVMKLLVSYFCGVGGGV